MSEIDYNLNGEFEVCCNGGIYYLQSKLFDSLRVKHFFSMRFGGVSHGDFDSLNVSDCRKDRLGNCDEPDNVYENYRRLFACFNTLPMRMASAKQVHGDDCYVVDEKSRGLNIPYFNSGSGEDCLVLRSDNKFIDGVSVKTADCVPILFYDNVGKNVAAVHAGHRGTGMKIASKCAKKLAEISGCGYGDIFVAIGPCIGKCCYEVSRDVAENIRNALSDNKEFITSCTYVGNDKFMLDLAMVNKLILENQGIPTRNISLCQYKTCCCELQNEKAFFSHRKSGGFSGTFASAIFVR